MMDYIETARKTIKNTPKQTIKKEKIDMDKQTFIKAKQAHKGEIAKLKQDIKKHKLLMKQAKIVYKLSKMKGGK